jgi:peptidyl-prolyl cis-trans isomerase B (cyclophilin B)
MTRWDVYCKWVARHLAVALFAGCLSVLGCGKSEPPKAQAPADNDTYVAPPVATSDEKPPTPKEPTKEPTKDPVDDPLHQPFAKAVRPLTNPPIGCAVPAKTASGKSVYKIYESVATQWDGIRFTTADGKRIHYSATIQTAYGEIDIELRPDLAPNHVRSFVALARAGFYEQLFFDHVHHEEFPEIPGLRNDFLEAGCPTGGLDDDNSFGSVGYWLYPETVSSEKATHVEGTVGAVHGFEKDSAGCKFYIYLCKNTHLDTHYTIFGQVTHGLDVARKIFEQPISANDAAMRGHFGLLKPANPVMIQKVIIHTREDGAEGKN